MDITLQQIKDECAQDKGYEDFEDLITSCHLPQLEDVINNIAIEAQKECLKNAEIKVFNDMETYWNYAISSYDCVILKQSITNENNIIR